MAIMTKRGNLDNIVTYEHICDTYEDLQNIDPKYATLGSTAIIINQEEGLNAYMATSAGEWVAIGTASSGGGEGGGGITPTGTYNITANGTYNVTRYATAKVNVPTAASNLKAITISPSSSQQVVLPSDENCDAFNQITVEPISSQYIIPTGTKTITENGTRIDVRNYSFADVIVPEGAGTVEIIPIYITIEGLDTSNAALVQFIASTSSQSQLPAFNNITLQSGSNFTARKQVYIPTTRNNHGLLFIAVPYNTQSNIGIKLNTETSSGIIGIRTYHGSSYMCWFECEPNAEVIITIYRNS